jgi:hypothetical protein
VLFGLVRARADHRLAFARKTKAANGVQLRSKSVHCVPATFFAACSGLNGATQTHSWAGAMENHAMFRKLIDGYRNQAAQQLSDAEELESGRWRIGNQDGDQSSSIASNKRGLAARLLGLSKAYEDLDD